MPTRSPPRSRPNRDTDAPEYVLGTGEQESDRLGLQNRLWSASAHQLWERAGLRPGETVLDIGCGPGHATVELAEIVGPSGRIIAVDESPLFLKHLQDRATARRLTNVERFLGDAQQLEALLPQYKGKADLAYARWVLCFVPDPEAVVRGIASLLKPGGRVAVQDYFNYESMSIAPKNPAFTRVISAIGQSWRARGGDPDIVGRLPALFRKHGLELGDIRLNQRVARPASTIWAWPDSFWRSYLPRMVEMEAITPTERDDFEAAWKKASADPDVFMLLPPVYDLVAVKR
jgi:ubiquinone/menaquinone biosynthesis C-methylase UbiE